MIPVSDKTCGQCTSSQAPEAACSPISSSAMNPSSPSSRMLTAAACCASDPQTAGFPACTSITATYASSTLDLGRDEWIRLQRASLARMFLPPAVAPVSQASEAASSGRSSGQLTLFGPDSSGSKTPRESAPRAAAKSSPPSWRADIPGETEPLPRLTLAPDMNGAAGGSLLPTLTVCGNWNRKGVSANSGDGLATALKRIAPTLLAGSGKQSGTYRRGNPTLRGWIRLLPTICATDYKSPYSEAGYLLQTQKRSKPLRDTLAHTTGHRLTPAFAEWWMGWPLGWTASSALVTGKSRSRRQRPGSR